MFAAEIPFVGRLAEHMTLFLTGLLERVFGPGVSDAVLGRFSWADFCVLFCFLLLVFVIHRALSWMLRWRMRRAEARAENKDWRDRLFQTFAKPFYLLVWVYGVYFAASPILRKLTGTGGSHPLVEFFDVTLDLGLFVCLFWLFFRLTRILEDRLGPLSAKSENRLDDALVRLLGRSLRVIVPVIGLILALPVIGLPVAYSGVVSKISGLLIIGAVSWILFQAVGAAERLILSKYDVGRADNLQARKIYTQVHVLSKTVYFLIGLFGAASALMLFEEVRRFGTSILASAGVIGVIVGFAAQRTIANLFAGFQLAVTQPIRLDDVVIVEGEWGRIEEITLTYVVVRIWDERRLIVPLSHFIEKPFQNWTRVSADLLGSVFVWADYSLPLAELRPAVQRIVESCKTWDRRFWNLQVTDATDRAMQLRVLATASDASSAWALRCEIREKLISFIQQKFPQCLPRVRAEVAGVEVARVHVPASGNRGSRSVPEGEGSSEHSSL
ncbi:MAG: mechanosensitive ion channel [Verrucomicrobia bacterium]|nr:mechanosensitive ion channel [Verrucomicrobiota bacterium]